MSYEKLLECMEMVSDHISDPRAGINHHVMDPERPQGNRASINMFPGSVMEMDELGERLIRENAPTDTFFKYIQLGCPFALTHCLIYAVFQGNVVYVEALLDYVHKSINCNEPAKMFHTMHDVYNMAFYVDHLIKKCKWEINAPMKKRNYPRQIMIIPEVVEFVQGKVSEFITEKKRTPVSVMEWHAIYQTYFVHPNVFSIVT